MSDEATQAGIGSAHLSTDLEDDGPYPFYGVALGVDDITVGQSGIKKKWTSGALEAAADTLAGQPLVKDHRNNTDGKIGEVLESKFKEGVGVLYKAEIASHYKEKAQDIKAGLLDVSPRIYHDPVESLEEEEETGALIIDEETVGPFDNLSVVNSGASPSNSAVFGEAEEFASVSDGNGVAVLQKGVTRLTAEELQQEFDSEELAFHGPALDEIESFANTDDNSRDSPISDLVEWSDSDHVQSAAEAYVESSDDASMDDSVSTLESWIESDMEDSDSEEMSLHAIKIFGSLHVRDDFVDQGEVEDVVDELESHEAVNVIVGSDSNMLLVIDSELVESNSDLNDHIIETLDETPFEVFEEWNWIDRTDDQFTTPRVTEDAEELATINDLNVNGTVMWGDGNMGVIAGFEEDGDSLMVEIDVMEKTEEGPFRKTGETVTRMLHDGTGQTNEEMLTMEAEQLTYTLRLETWTAEELQEISVHKPEWSDTRKAPWNKPSLEDFTDDSWEDLDSDEQSSIADHFLVSKSGFPPDNFGDLALPVVDAEGNLVLNALQNAKARAGQVSGLSGDALDRVENMIDDLANDNYRDADFGDEEEDSEENAEAAVGKDDDDQLDSDGQSKSVTIAALTQQDNKNMTEIDTYNASDVDFDEDDYVAVDRSELEAVVEKAQKADTVDDQLEEMSTTLGDLATAQEKIEDVDEDDLDELREFDSPVVLANEEYEELTGLVDDVASIYAEELEKYGPFEAEELQDRFSPMELRDRVEEHDEASIEQDISEATEDVDPKGENASEEELSENPEEEEGEIPEEMKREAVARKLEEQDLPTQAEQVRSGKLSLDELGVTVEAE